MNNVKMSLTSMVARKDKNCRHLGPILGILFDMTMHTHSLKNSTRMNGFDFVASTAFHFY